MKKYFFLSIISSVIMYQTYAHGSCDQAALDKIAADYEVTLKETRFRMEPGDKEEKTYYYAPVQDGSNLYWLILYKCEKEKLTHGRSVYLTEMNGTVRQNLSDEKRSQFLDLLEKNKVKEIHGNKSIDLDKMTIITRD